MHDHYTEAFACVGVGGCLTSFVHWSWSFVQGAAVVLSIIASIIAIRRRKRK